MWWVERTHPVADHTGLHTVSCNVVLCNLCSAGINSQVKLRPSRSCCMRWGLLGARRVLLTGQAAAVCGQDSTSLQYLGCQSASRITFSSTPSPVALQPLQQKPAIQITLHLPAPTACRSHGTSSCVAHRPRACSFSWTALSCRPSQAWTCFVTATCSRCATQTSRLCSKR